MARDRWTLALIIICVPILATVITAFRIRDLPKSHETSNLETKTKPCENCDVKVGQKVHSVKIESDKHKHEDFKKAVREKQQLINDKTSETKTIHKLDVRSDEDSDDEVDLEFSTIQTGFRQEYTKANKLNKKELNINHNLNVKKINVGINTKEDDSDDDDDENDDDDVKSKITLKPETHELKKIPEKINTAIKRPDINVLVKKVELKKNKHDSEDDASDNDDDDDDNDNDYKNKVQEMLYPKVVDTKKKILDIPKQNSKIKQAQILELKKQKIEIPNDEGDNDNDENNEEDEYKGLDNLDELFKILDIKPGSKLKKQPSDVKPKVTHHIEIKRGRKDNEGNNSDEIDDDDDDDDDDDNNDNSEQNKINNRSVKLLSSEQETVSSIKKSEDQPTKTEKQEKNDLRSMSKDIKEKREEIIKKLVTTQATNTVKKDNKHLKLKLNPSSETKLPDSAKIDEKLPNKANIEDYIVKEDKNKITENKKSPSVINKENEKEKIATKSVAEKQKIDSGKKSKEPEKVTVEPKSREKDVKTQENKKPIIESKKKKTDQKEIFKTPEHKKEIKYEFEKPNAYKESHKTFNYSEFEKIQVTKSHSNEKKKAKVSTETVSDSREENYLKHVTDALNRRNLLKSEFEDFYAFLPTFAPNFSRIHNQECRRHGQILLRQLRGTKLWALNMLDATAKIPSGVLRGNGIQLGDFDQCLGSQARVQLDTGSVVRVQGKYCLASLELRAEHAELEGPVYLAQAKSLIRSRLDDPGHFVPRFSTLSWGVCVPAACDREDVEVVVKDALKHYQHKSGLLFKVKVDEHNCHVDEGDGWEKWLETPTLLTLSFYGVVLLLVLVATVQDFFARRQYEEETDEKTENNQKDELNKVESNKQSEGILSPFSLYRSVSRLMAPGTSDEIPCIHGVRAVAALALLAAHKFMPVAAMPYTNRVNITETASSWVWSWCRAGWVFTDCFLLLSGTLASHRVASDHTGALKRLFYRYLRLTPALLAVVLFYAYIWDKVSSGPMWGTFVTKNAQICERGWWWNLLYLQNYFGLEDMCAPQTHQLALDMQLSAAGGAALWALRSGRGGARLLLPAAHLLAAYARYTTVRDHRLTLLAYHGVSVSQLYRTARLSYTSALHRCSPYLVGVSLGLALRAPTAHGKFLLSVGWMTSAGLSALVAWSGLDAGSPQYRYNTTAAAQYAAVAPVASAMAIAWLIYAVHSGTCDFLSRLLCCRPLVFISRISYALYLTQFIVFITNIGTVRAAREFTLTSLIDAQEISAIILSAVVLTLTFVIPMQSIHKVFSFQWKSDTEDSSEKEKEKSEQKIKEEPKIEERNDSLHSIRNRHILVAHREILEEILEMEVEYETQRKSMEGLDEIMEEEEGIVGEDEDQIDDLEIIEEEEAGEEEAWLEREEERSYSRQDDQDLDEWEWTSNGSRRSGAQYYRYAR